MQPPLLHKFKIGERHFVIDPSTCFCFECDNISWDVLEHYPREPVNRIYHLLQESHPRKELEEVVGELEWLRITKAILIQPREEELLKEAMEKPGLGKITVMVPEKETFFEAQITAAGTMLLAASGTRTELTLLLIFPEDYRGNAEALALALLSLKRAAKFAGKQLQITVQIPVLPPRGAAEKKVCYSLQVTPHDTTDIAKAICDITALRNCKFSKIADTMRRRVNPERGTIIACPQDAHFPSLLQEMYEAGFRDMVLDIPGAYAENPQLDPMAVAESLRANAAWYAEQLLQHHYFKAEPFTRLFDAVHQGKPVRRMDAAGCSELAVDGEGRIYPSVDFMGQEDFIAGTLQEGKREESVLHSFDALGVAQMPSCMQCWARCLCGGGHGIIHWRQTGNPCVPDSAWCDTQRHWLAYLIDAFNSLVASGINFSQITGAMASGGKKVSWMKAAKMAYQMRLVPRSLQESDAEWLVKWENWNSAAYFVCSDSGLLLAARYDREMDALHPRGMDQELVLTRPDGTPCGLLKMRPDVMVKGLARVWLYMRENKSYTESGVRRALGALLTETLKSRGFKRILVPVTPAETELATCLQALGFQSSGIQRQALYLHGSYQDIQMFLYE
ncbi:MAG: hypothetical protein KAH38_01330, partial [Candidatus Hydrogenedentes bacterium]|nr:hypothetical protein [Candidatus Hydrogenedentota bacterium]